MTSSQFQSLPISDILQSLMTNSLYIDSNKQNKVIINKSAKLPTKRCLFGPPNPQDTTKLLKEQMEIDKQRMLNMWCFDITTEKPTVDNVWEKLEVDQIIDGIKPIHENEVEEAYNSAKVKTSTKAKITKRITISTPYARNHKITDFWKAKKSNILRHRIKTSETQK